MSKLAEFERQRIETHKLSLAQREATPNKDKPCPKRDLSPGTPDSDLASPERKQPVISKFNLDLTDTDMDNSSSISVHSSDFDSDICTKLEKDLTEALSTSPRQADDGGVTMAMADVTSTLPDIKLPISTSTPAHPNTQDTVPCPLTPLTSTIIDLDELDTNLNETPEPTPPTALDQDIHSPAKGLACPNTQDTVPDIRDNSTSHPQNIFMTDLNDNDNDNPQCRSGQRRCRSARHGSHSRPESSQGQTNHLKS